MAQDGKVNICLPDKVASSTLTVWGLFCKCLRTHDGLLGFGLGKYFRLGAGGVANTVKLLIKLKLKSILIGLVGKISGEKKAKHTVRSFGCASPSP